LLKNNFWGVIMQLAFNQNTESNLKNLKKLVYAVAISVLMATSSTYADEDHHANERDYHGREAAREHHEARRDHYVFALRDVHRFNHDEFNLWRGGRWNQTCYLGRCGWWWFTGGQWYFYDRPLYPYPLMVSEVTYLEPLAPQVPVMAAPPAPVSLPAQTWYYCESARSYYPYVPSCPEGWKPVPAQPPRTR